MDVLLGTRWEGLGLSDDRPHEHDAEMTGRDADATPDLLSRVYDELRRIAGDYMRRERAGHTLQPTALVHEAYLRLAELDRIEWKDKTHFLVAASGAIRRVLVDHARGRSALKRGGAFGRVTLTDVADWTSDASIDLLALDESLLTLAELDSRKARVVELRFFGGLTIQEVADVLDIGTTTVEDDWAFARTWLRQKLGDVDEATS